MGACFSIGPCLACELAASMSSESCPRQTSKAQAWQVFQYTTGICPHVVILQTVIPKAQVRESLTSIETVDELLTVPRTSQRMRPNFHHHHATLK